MLKAGFKLESESDEAEYSDEFYQDESVSEDTAVCEDDLYEDAVSIDSSGNDSNVSSISESIDKLPMMQLEEDSDNEIGKQKPPKKKNRQRKQPPPTQPPKQSKKKENNSKITELKCSVCGESFDSRNKLFRHIEATGHAALKTRKK